MASATPVAAPILPARYRDSLDDVLHKLRRTLRDNLWSCVLYGSAVRGDLVDGVSDINLLIVLRRSTPDAHAAIADILTGPIDIDPMVLEHNGLRRSLSAFAAKFRSIRRHYRVLAGEDPFEGHEDSPNLLRFLTEQALRNARLRAVHAFIRFGGDPPRYRRYLLEIEPALFTHLSDALRLEGQQMPQDFEDRIAVIEAGFGHAMPILGEVLELHTAPQPLLAEDVQRLHRALFDALDHVVHWVERQWPA